MLRDDSAVLPWHVDRTCGCTASVFDVHAFTDGTTREYYCDVCSGFIADLIEGAEP